MNGIQVNAEKKLSEGGKNAEEVKNGRTMEGMGKNNRHWNFGKNVVKHVTNKKTFVDIRKIICSFSLPYQHLVASFQHSPHGRFRNYDAFDFLFRFSF